MEDMKVSPTTTNYNALIRTYSEAAVPWDEFTYHYLLAAAVAAGQVKLAVELLSGMRKDGVRPQARHYITVFLGLAQNGYYEDAMRVFQRLRSMGICSTYAFNVMIGIQCRRRDMEAAMESMDTMKEAGAAPDVMSFRLLLEGYAYKGDLDSVLQLQAAVTSHRENLQRVVRDYTATEAAREAATVELERQHQWRKVYDRLIDAALWNGEWSRGVGLLKDLVDLGIPVDVTKHRRLLQDMKEFFSGKDGALGIAAEVIRDDGESSLPAMARMDEDSNREDKATAATVAIPNRFRYQTSVEVSRVSSVQIPLHAFAASFSPHWLDGEARSQVSVEMCMRMLREESSESFDAASAYDVMHSYYHCTLHRRAVVPVDLPDGQLLRVRAGPETLQSLRELFDRHGWPNAANAPSYAFLRPSACSLDAFLVLLALAALFPRVLLLRDAPISASASPGAPGASAPSPSLSKQSLQRWSRAVAVTISATLKAFPVALLVGSRTARTLLATGDLEDTSQDFERKLRTALAGAQLDLEVGAQEQLQESSRTEFAARWDTWLKAHGLERLLRHDGQRLRLDGTNGARPARAEVTAFQVRSSGQVDLES
ncbi:Pentatricopeptide repeat-containing protein At5g39710 (Protein EMBRYO DEFECTIVE 2745) [Durusdinium trenchii]|uniref:Pentatricopeptide repeat-containing protein At5g39710 (Protein EMBRYO DEFECTIVE 2745) n=1 Tax=Durusdinium trenchii TaxID=1381693 RepID=A0ABP0KP11_9DINO